MKQTSRMGRSIGVRVFAVAVVTMLVAACGPGAEDADPPEAGVAEEGAEEAEVAAPEEAPSEEPEHTDAELVISEQAEPDTLDPHVTGSRRAYAVMMNVFDSLVARDEDGQFHPSLATSWDHDDEGTVYTFHLRDDVTFHDGTPFDAEAVVFNLERVVDPDTASRNAVDLLGPYESSEALDDHTVEVRFSDPIAPTTLLDGLSTAWLGIISPSAAEEHGEDFGRNPVGSGPFRFAEWRPQDGITLERNDDYAWGSSMYSHQGPPALAEVRFHYIPEPATAVLALEQGEVDLVREVPIESIQELADDPDFEVIQGIAHGFPAVYWFNTEVDPLDDVRVRQAMIHGFNREGLTEGVYQGWWPPVEGPLSPPTWGYSDAVEGMYPYDPDRAAELLDEAGWELEDDGYRYRDGERLTLRLGDLFERRRVEYFQAQMEQIGVDVDGRIVTSDELWGMTREAEDYEMASTWMGGSDPNILSTVFHSRNVGTGFAISRWQNDELDSMLDQGIGIVDPDERAQLYEDVQIHVMENALMVPLHALTLLDAIDARFEGYYHRRGRDPVLYEIRVAE